MKKTVFIICAVALLCSCRLYEGNPNRPVRDRLVSYTEGNIIHGELSDASRCFQLLYSLDKFRNFDNKELLPRQWFYGWGLYVELGYNTLHLDRANLDVKTNGMDWRATDSRYVINGFTFLCIGDNQWEASCTSGLFSSRILFTIDSEVPRGVTYTMEAEGQSVEKDYSAEYDANLQAFWETGPGYIGNLVGDVKKGQIKVKIYEAGSKTPKDWVNVTFAGGVRIPEYETSRD